MNSLVKSLIVIPLLLLLAAGSLHAQFRRADRLFESGEYVKAISAYERGLRRHPNPNAMERLANSYRIVRKYEQSEYWYAKAIAAKPEPGPMLYFWYGTVLKMNGKPTEARQQFANYLALQPNDMRAKGEVKALDNLKVWMEETRLYTVHSIPALNSPQSDFGAAYYGNNLLLVSDRGERDLLNDENAGASDNAYFAIYNVPITARTGDSMAFGKLRILPRRISSDAHNGPVSLTSDQKLMAFTRVDRIVKLRSRKFVNRNKIFFTNHRATGWSKPEAFLWNSDLYSCSHPALTPDGQTLFFASDMPGSVGGMDIWMCRRDGDTWGKPINLGSIVNTTGEELFPFIRTDGQLFFSSDGHPGLGGLDIFSTKQNGGNWEEPANQGAPLNSSTDDFSLVFDAEGKAGFFASDRAGGKGKDDVYGFRVAGNFTTIRGKLLTSKNIADGLPDARVQLLNGQGVVLKQTLTDRQGGFVFRNIAADQSYMVRLEEDDPVVMQHNKYYLADETNTVVRVAVADAFGGPYTFKDLPVQSNTPPQLIADDEYLTLAGNLVTDGATPNPIANAKVNLVDEQGNVVQTTTTNAFGAFAFSRIPPDKSYIVSLDTTADVQLNAQSRVVITDKSGKQLMSATPDANGKFNFRILQSDRTTLTAMTVQDEDLRYDLGGQLTGGDSTGKAVAGAKVSVVDPAGKVIQTVKTDANGSFRFTNLPTDKTYLVRVDGVEDSYLMSIGQLFLKDNNGKVVKVLRQNGTGFEYRVLPSDRTTLGTIYVDDPWLQVLQMKAKEKNDSLLIIENIYYEVDDWRLLPEAERTLTKVLQVMKSDPNIIIEISAHTDSRATDEYNKKLSLKRAQTVVDYLVARGIDRKRLTAVGYGETRLLNKCADGLECTDVEHAKNRRTEFKINRR